MATILLVVDETSTGLGLRDMLARAICRNVPVNGCHLLEEAELTQDDLLERRRVASQRQLNEPGGFRRFHG